MIPSFSRAATSHAIRLRFDKSARPISDTQETSASYFLIARNSSLASVSRTYQSAILIARFRPRQSRRRLPVGYFACRVSSPRSDFHRVRFIGWDMLAGSGNDLRKPVSDCIEIRCNPRDCRRSLFHDLPFMISFPISATCWSRSSIGTWFPGVFLAVLPRAPSRIFRSYQIRADTIRRTNDSLSNHRENGTAESRSAHDDRAAIEMPTRFCAPTCHMSAPAVIFCCFSLHRSSTMCLAHDGHVTSVSRFIGSPRDLAFSRSRDCNLTSATVWILNIKRAFIDDLVVNVRLSLQ